jgi:hypothetical protein
MKTHKYQKMLPLIRENGDKLPLEMILDSHKRDLLPIMNESTTAWEIRFDQYRDDDVVSAEVNLGQENLMSPLTVHHGVHSGTPGQNRLALSMRFENANEVTSIGYANSPAYRIGEF